MRQEDLKNLMFTGQIEGNRDRKKATHNLPLELERRGAGFESDGKKPKFINK